MEKHGHQAENRTHAMLPEDDVHPIPLVVRHLEVPCKHVDLLPLFHLLDQRLDVVGLDGMLLEVEVDWEEEGSDAESACQDGPPPGKSGDTVDELDGRLEKPNRRVPTQPQAGERLPFG